MTQEEYELLLPFAKHMEFAINSSFVRMSTREFNELEAAYVAITGDNEPFNHGCGRCNLNFVRKVARFFFDPKNRPVVEKPEPNPVTPSKSETKAKAATKKATIKEQNGRKKGK